MSESSLSISPLVETCAGGVIGLGLGYSMAPAKYSLKNLITLNKAKLSEFYSNDVSNFLSSKEKNALDAIFTATDEYHSSKLEKQKEIKQAAATWQKLFREIDVPKTLKNNYLETRDILIKAVKKENYIALNKQYRSTKKAAQDAPDNKFLQEALLSAYETLSTVKIRLAGKIENYKNTVKNIQKERLYAIKTNPDKWIKVKEAYKNFLIAKAGQRTITSNKLFELANNKNLLNSYQAIKEYIPKARIKSAITGSIIVGGITSLIVTKFNENAV